MTVDLPEPPGCHETAEPLPGIRLVLGDCLGVLREIPDRSLHGAVTDPPYGGHEFEEDELRKLRSGSGGTWRVPPALGGLKRRPVPRFTEIGAEEIERTRDLLRSMAAEILRILVPGSHVLVASNPLVQNWALGAVAEGELEVRGTVIRTVQTLRGGDRPKNAHLEFPDATVIPRGCWEPWGLFRVPLEGTVAENLRRWGTGALRRTSAEAPFRDLVPCSPTPKREREICPHPSLKPQRFLRHVTRAMLPLGEGILIDPFCGSGSTVAAAANQGIRAIGIERDAEFFRMAVNAVPRLSALEIAEERSGP